MIRWEEGYDESLFGRLLSAAGGRYVGQGLYEDWIAEVVCNAR